MGLFSRRKTNRVKKAPRKGQRAKGGKGARKANKATRTLKLRAPRLDAAHLAAALRPVRLLGIAALALAGMVLAWRVLDRPVTSIEVTAPFQRVTPMQVEDHVRLHLDGGILSGDLLGVRDSLEALDWVDTVRIRRRWPSRLHITVDEQVPAARWGERGLLNTRGELFVTDARHVPAELPMLSGPEGSQWQVAQRYLALREPMLAAGLQLKSVTLDTRGSWRLSMSRGIEVRLGRHAVDQRIDRFIDVVTPMIAGRTEVVDYVDLRYTNGFAIGWHEVTANAVGEAVVEVLEDDDA